MKKEQKLTEIGVRVELQRKKSGLSQEELAIKCGISRATIIRIEQGAVESRSGVLRKISDALGVQLSYLLEGGNIVTIEDAKALEEVEHGRDEFLSQAFGYIPGWSAVERVLNFRASLKQKRTIIFSAEVKTCLEEVAGRELHASDFTTEDFIDVMESVMNRVQITKSVYKLERFRNIIVRQIVDPIEIHETQKFIHILDSLQDIDLVILEKMRNNDKIQYVSDFPQLLIGGEGPYEDEHPVIIEAGGNQIEITVGDIEFYVNRLASLGLLKLTTIQAALPSSNQRLAKIKSYQTLLISNMGKKFLSYIETLN